MKRLFIMAAAMAIVITADAKVNERIVNDDATDSVLVVKYENAKFPGGEDACREWIERHVKYPSACAEQNVEGYVQTSFVVEADGNVSDIRTLGNPDHQLAKEVERVIAMMPLWTPGTANGQPTRARYTLQVNFKMKTNN